MVTNEIKIALTGIRPLLMARGEVSNPFDPQGREIKSVSQKKKKTDTEYELLAYLQFVSSMYLDDQIGPYVPVDNLWKCLENGAAKYKESSIVKSQTIIKGLVDGKVDEGAAKLIYPGPRDPKAMYNKGFAYLKMGKIPGSRTSILTSRARFAEWRVEFVVEYTDVDPTRILDYWRMAGRFVGIGAWRPRHGLFSPEMIK
jgi:hypothetical protein